MGFGKDLIKVAAVYATAAASTMLGFFGASKVVEALDKRSKKKAEEAVTNTNKED